jgi:hypothetical protein
MMKLPGNLSNADAIPVCPSHPSTFNILDRKSSQILSIFAESYAVGPFSTPVLLPKRVHFARRSPETIQIVLFHQHGKLSEP